MAKKDKTKYKEDKEKIAQERNKRFKNAKLSRRFVTSIRDFLTSLFRKP